MILLINAFGRHFCRPCDRRHIIAQMAGDLISLTQVDIPEARFMVYINPSLLDLLFFLNSRILQTGILQTSPNQFVENRL